MYKYLVLLTRKDGLRHEEFAQYWQQEHAAIARTIEGSVRYHQVLPTDPETAEFDGIAEVYFETLEDLRAAFGGPDTEPDPDLVSAKEARHDTANFLDVHQIQQLAGEEVVQKDEVDGDTHGLYKHSAFLVRKDGMSHEAFREYWEHEHTPLARDIEGVVRYTTVYPAEPDAAPFDGVAELYFDSLDALQDALGSPGSRDYDPTKEIATKARADVDNFLAVEDRPRLIGQEHVVKDQT